MSADAGRILHTPCFDKELVHCFLFPDLRKVTTDKEICGCVQPSGRMTNKQSSLLSSKKGTTFQVLVLAACQLMQTQELLVKSSQTWSQKKYLLQSPRRSEAAPMLLTLPVLLLWFILPSVSIPESDEKGSQGHDEWVEARSRQLSWPLRSLS